jgi:hypothetical protein
VLFLNRHYAQAQSPTYARAPHAFLLALTCLAPPCPAPRTACRLLGCRRCCSALCQHKNTSSPQDCPHACRKWPLSLFVTLHHHDPIHNNPRPPPPSTQQRRRQCMQQEQFWAVGHDSSQGSSAFSHTHCNCATLQSILHLHQHLDIISEDNKNMVHPKVTAHVICMLTEQEAQLAARVSRTKILLPSQSFLTNLAQAMASTISLICWLAQRG